MLLQCETDCGAGGASIRRRRGCAARHLESLIELNEVCLELLAAQARASCGSALLAADRSAVERA